MARFIEKLRNIFANSKTKKQSSEEYQIVTGKQVSYSGYNVGDSVSQEAVTQSLLNELRGETDTGNQIEILVNRDPDVSMAVWAFQRLAFKGFKIEITDLNGKRLPEAEKLFNQQCKFWNTLSNDGLDGIVDNLHKTGLLYNIMMIEVVVSNNSLNTFDGIYIIDPREIEWTLEERDGKQVWIPYQNQSGNKVDLTTGNVFWAIVNQDVSTPIGPYLLQPAIAAIDYKLQTIQDSSLVLRRQGYPFNIWSLNKERLVNTMPAADRNNSKKVKDAISKAVTDAQAAASSRQPTQDIVVTDDIEINKSSNSTAGSSIDVRAWFDTVDKQVMNGLKSLGIILNRVEGNTETWGSVQMKIIVDMVESFQNKTKRLVEQIGGMWLQLNGIQGNFKMTHNPLDYQSELQKWEAQLKKDEHFQMIQNQRWVDANTAASGAIGAESAVYDLFATGNVKGVTSSGNVIEETVESDSQVENNDTNTDDNTDADNNTNTDSESDSEEEQ